MRHSSVLCSCPRDALCDRCRESLWMQLKGTAAARGEAWADSVAARVPRHLVWPAYRDKAAELARAKVSDLASDPLLLEMLAAELYLWAAARWLRPS